MNLATLSCWGYYQIVGITQIATVLRWIWPPSVVGDTIRLLALLRLPLCWGESGHPQLLGILSDCWHYSDCHCVEVNLATLSCWGYYQIVGITQIATVLRWIWPPSVVGDTIRLLALLRLPLCWGESGHPQLLGILSDCWHYSDCHCVEVNLATLSCWGYYQIVGITQIATVLRWIWPPSVVGDTIRLLALLRLPLCWGESGHPQLLGILSDCWHYSDCHCVEVNLATLSCWGYYQIVGITQITTVLRWIWPPSVVGDTIRLLALLRLPLCWGESGHTQLLGILSDCWHYSDCHCVEVNLATLSCWGYNQIVGTTQIATVLRWIWPPSVVGDTIRLLALLRLPLCWGESGQPQLLGILSDCWHYSDCHCVEVNLATLSCWGYYQIVGATQIATVLRWIWPASVVGDTIRLLALLRLPLCWGESGHPQLLGILSDCWRYSDCHCVEVNLATLSCWGYYQIVGITQIATVLRWIWPASVVGDTIRLLALLRLPLCWGESGHPQLLGILSDCWHYSDCHCVEVNLATLSCWGYYQIVGITQIATVLRWIWPPSVVGDTIRLLALLRLPLCWGESGQPQLLGILSDCWHYSDCHCVEVNLATLSCWGYYQIVGATQIATVLRWIWPPSVVGDTIRLLALLRLPLCWGESGQPQLLGILSDCWHYSDCHCVEVNLATLSCWGYYQIVGITQIATVLRWIWPPSVVGNTIRLLALLRLPLCWGESGHPQLLGILSDCWHYSDCHCVEVNLASLSCWGYYQIVGITQIATVLRWIWPPSVVGDTIRLLALLRLPLCWGESGHPQLLGILSDCWHYSDCHCVEVNLASLSCWGYYQI